MNEPPKATETAESPNSSKDAISGRGAETVAEPDAGPAGGGEKRRNAAVSCLVPGPFEEEAVIRAAKACREGLGRDPDLVLAFVSSDFRSGLKRFLETLAIDGRAGRVLGCSGGGLLGVGREFENQSGFSLLFLSLPRTDLEWLAGWEAGAPASRARGSVGEEGDGATASAALIALVHPLRENGARLLRSLSESHPGSPAIGGFATGGPEEEDLFLFTERGLASESALVLSLRGGVRVVPLVAQSCRPIGRPLIVTGAKRNEVLSLGRRPALEVLEESFAGLDDEIRALAEGNVFAGLATREEVEDFSAGDFLIRQIVSARLEDGRLRLGARPRAGQTLQFQVREARTAESLLESAAERAHVECGKPFAIAAFSGKGRGKALFDAEDRDARKLGELFGEGPLAGCFTHGEIGPVGGVNHRHDHSLCAALFCDEAAL